MDSLHKNHTYDLLKVPIGKKALKKWVFKTKTEEKSSQPRYKLRLVKKGSCQKKGVAFEKSLMVMISPIRVVLGMIAV